LIEQTIWLNSGGKNGSQLIQKLTALQRAALLATLPGCAPHHLEASLPQRQNSERSFRPKQLTGPVMGEPPQNDLGSETTLAIGHLPVTDSPGFSGGGSRSISRNDQGI
jgi:hypothetical protein